MPLYVFRCRGGFRFLVKAAMAEAGKPCSCPCGEGAERVFTAPVIVMRPPNYSASPDDPAYWEGIHDDPEYLPCQIAPMTADELARVCPYAKERGA
jgi:putative FmdB family regulatory protein